MLNGELLYWEITENGILKKFAITVFLAGVICLISYNSVYGKPLSKASEKSPCVISAVGDSITYSATYAAVLDALPHIKVNNYGMSATQVAGVYDHSFVNRTHDKRFKSDIILIFGGTNDYKGLNSMCNPLGTVDSDDITTYFGAYNEMLKNIKKKNPKSQIVLVTPIKRAYWDKPNAYGFNLAHYAAATQMIAYQNNVYCLDLFNNPACDFTNNGMLIDGIHPNNDGHNTLAAVIYQSLLQLP